MENLKDKLKQLFNKPEWTSEEKQWLLQYLEREDAEGLKALMKEQFQTEQTQEANQQAQLAEALSLIHEKIGLRQRGGRIVEGRKTFRRVLAAACVAGVLIAGGYFFQRQNNTKAIAMAKAPAAVHKNDVLPGGNKAVLTLADGSVIELNDNQNGELAEQGHTKVLKLNGQLTYQSSGSASGKPLYNTITTPRGGQYQVVLADGSSVWLNAESSLRFPANFVGRERRVEIKGEAYFEVVKNNRMPFIVSVNGSEVQVLGTHFNVKAYDDEDILKTTLLEGSVKFVAGNRTVVLKPGQQSQRQENGDVNVVSGIDLEKEIAWKNGYFDLDGESLPAVVRQLSRWYDIEVIETKKITEKFYAEIPRNTKLSDVLHALELTGKVHFQIEGKKVFVRP